MAPRRVMIVCYYFPPMPSVGSVRVGALAKYLPRHGWETIVVTPERSGRTDHHTSELIETPDADRGAWLKRRLGMDPGLALKDQLAASSAPTASRRARIRALGVELGKALVAFPDSNRGWIAHAIDGAIRGERQRPIDLILTSSPPVSAHLAGRRISRRLGRPWVADLRDLWSQDHNSTAPAWRRSLERRLERRTFADAAALVTVSDPLAAQLRGLHTRAPVHTILNGFDPELQHLGRGPTDRFTLCHTGTFYQGRRDPTMLFETLAALLESGPLERDRVRLRLFSRQEPWLQAAVDRHRLRDVVVLEPWVAWEEALRAQQEAQVLLLLHWGGVEERGVYTGKIFEYLAARRPILMIGGGDGVLADLLRETGSGTHVRDRATLEAQLIAYWEEFVTTGGVRYLGEESRLSRFSHDRMASEFARLFSEVVENHGRPDPGASPSNGT